MSNTLLVFKASWCRPCKNMEPVLGDLKTQGYKIETYDVEDHPDVTKEYSVGSVPTLVFVNKNEEEFHRIVGATTYANVRRYMDNG